MQVLTIIVIASEYARESENGHPCLKSNKPFTATLEEVVTHSWDI